MPPTLPVSQDQKSWHRNTDPSRYVPSTTTASGLVLLLSVKSTSTRRAQISSSAHSPSCALSVEWCRTSRWAFTPSLLPSLPPPVPSLGEAAHFYTPFLSYFLDFLNTWPTLPTHLNSSSLSFSTHSFTLSTQSHYFNLNLKTVFSLISTHLYSVHRGSM